MWRPATAWPSETGSSSGSEGRLSSRPSRRVGVLGGTFDPIHSAHLAVARAALRELRLDEVLFVPAADPYLRAAPPVASAAERAEMVRLAVGDEPRFRLSTVDMERGGPSYSVDTVHDLREELGPETKLFVIVGADALEQLPEWRRPDELLRDATLVCVGRPGELAPEALPAGHPGRNALYVEGPMLDVSSTAIRERVAAGSPLGEDVPPRVAEFIVEHGVYRHQGASTRSGT